MNHAPVTLGSILFTLVEPHRGHEVAYNRWYERDHFYSGCMIGPGILAGARFVAPRRYKDLRVVPPASPVAPDAATGSYLALYWIERGMQDEWGTWAARQVADLHRAGRMFGQRDHVHTKMYRYRWGAFRDDDSVPPELALDHRFAGVAAVFLEAPDDRDAVGAWLQDEHLPSALGGTSTAMVLAFTPVPIPEDAPADVPRVAEDERRILALAFVDRDPIETWDGELVPLVEGVEASGRANVLWAGPFIPTVPGTDTYADELS